jgi:hypothetical protein
VLNDCAAGRCATVYEGGQVEPADLLPARWDLMPENRYMWASVQTVRGCPKHCSFCSVWKTDGQRPRRRASDLVIEEIVTLRRRGFRFIALADDDFYPVTLTDLHLASRRADRAQFDAAAEQSGVTFAQFVMLTPFPGTTDFAAWEKSMVSDPTRVAGRPLTRHWLIPQGQRPKVDAAHPVMSADDIRRGTQGAWDRFYSFRNIWERAHCVESLKSRLALVLISKLYRQMYANTGIATDSPRLGRSAHWARWIAKPCRRYSRRVLCRISSLRSRLTLMSTLEV